MSNVHTQPAPTRDDGFTPEQLARLTPQTLRRLAQASTWDSDRFANSRRSARRAWWAAGAGAVMGLLGLASAVLAHRTPAAPPMAVVVDRTTGHTQVFARVSQADVPALAVLDQHNASSYVRSREAYHAGLLQRDYDAVARMSTPEAFKGYGDRFVGERAMHKVIGTTQEHRVTIVSARPTRLPQPTHAGKKAVGRHGGSSDAPDTGEIVITFDKELRSPHLPHPTLTRHVATLQYEYRPSAMTREVDRIENPFGFIVTAYRVDTELAAPAPAAAPAAALAPAPTPAPARAAAVAATTGARQP
jgi:type IV secretion system protein VirB8